MRHDGQPDLVAVALGAGGDSTRLVGPSGITAHAARTTPGRSWSTVAREDYDRQGSWTLILPRTTAAMSQSDLELQPPSVPPNGPFSLRRDRWYITAYSQSCRDGRASSFLPALSRRHDHRARPAPGSHRVLYLKRPWLPGAALERDLAHRAPGAAVPPMVLVANERAIPLSADDGEIIARASGRPRRCTHPIRTPLEPLASGSARFLDPTIDPGSLAPHPASPSRGGPDPGLIDRRHLNLAESPSSAPEPVARDSACWRPWTRSQIKLLYRLTSRSSSSGARFISSRERFW